MRRSPAPVCSPARSPCWPSPASSPRAATTTTPPPPRPPTRRRDGHRRDGHRRDGDGRDADRRHGRDARHDRTSDDSTPGDGSASGDESDYVAALRANIELDDDEMATCLAAGRRRRDRLRPHRGQRPLAGRVRQRRRPAQRGRAGADARAGARLQAAFSECGELADAFISAESAPAGAEGLRAQADHRPRSPPPCSPTSSPTAENEREGRGRRGAGGELRGRHDATTTTTTTG